jgi:hypothetical protein
MSLTTTNINVSPVEHSKGEFQDDIITFAGADTFAAGTILARDSVSLKLVPFVKGGATNENGIPKAVLTYDITKAGAGDEVARVLIAGNVRKELLIIDADGDDSNIDDAVKDQLRDYNINPLNVSELNIQDNQ